MFDKLLLVAKVTVYDMISY